MTRSSKASTTSVAMSTPVPLVLKVRTTPELLALLALLSRIAMTIELPVHTKAARSSEQLVTRSSKAKTTSVAMSTPVPLVLLVRTTPELLALLAMLPRVSMAMDQPVHTKAARSSKQLVTRSSKASTTSVAMSTPVPLVLLVQELLALLALHSRFAMTMELPAHTKALRSSEQLVTRSSKANTTSVAMSTPVPLVLMVRTTPELLALLAMLSRFAMTMELPVHTKAARSSKQLVTRSSKAKTTSVAMSTPVPLVLMVRTTPELLALLAMLSRIVVTMELPVQTNALHSFEQLVTRSSKAKTTSVAMSTPVPLVLLVRATPVLLALLAMLSRFVVTMELPVHTEAARSSEQQATLRSMVSRTSEVTLAPPVLLVHFQTKTHQ